MATLAAAPPRARTGTLSPAAPGLWTPALTLWQREIVRFYRQKARVAGVIASPLLFWLALGSGFAHSFNSGGASSGGDHYAGFFFPGAVVMIVLFTGIFSMMSLIQDRNEGFLLSVLAAPVSRGSIVLGKVFGGATLAAIQGCLFLVFFPLAGVHPSVAGLAIAVLAILLISFHLTALGFAIAWPMDSTQAFHAIVNLILIPLWLLSGALFPVSGAAGWMRLVMLLNPLTYGVDLLRHALFPAAKTSFGAATNLSVTAGFCVLTFMACWAVVNRRSNRPAA